MGIPRRALVVAVVLAVVGGGIALGVVLSDSGSSGSDQSAPRYVYPKAAVEQLMTACQVRSSHATCVCVVNAFRNAMPYSTYRQITRQGVQSHTLAAWRAARAESAKCSR